MKVYNTITEYLQNFKVGDKIVLGGKGIICGINNVSSKYDVYTVSKETTKDKILFRAYRGRTNLTTNISNQLVGVLTEKEFKNLPQ